MCSSKAKVGSTGDDPAAAVAKINGRPVLQPTASSCNRVPAATLERRNSLKKLSTKSPLPPASFTSIKDVSKMNKNNDEDDGNCENADNASFKSPRPAAIKRTAATTTTTTKVVVGGPCLDRKKSKSFKETNTSPLPSSVVEASLSYSSSLIVDSPGSIAAVRREHMALQHAQRKMRIAHYGRSKSAKFTMMMSNDDYDHQAAATVPNNKNNNNSNNMFDMMTMYTYASSNTKETSTNNLKSKNNPPDSIVLAESTSTRGRRCSFITPNSDPIYVTYHDQEWGVPVHDDAMLFELLVLSGAQVGSDWVSILKRRQHFRDAFSGFDPQTVASISDKQMLSISAEYGIDISRIRGVVDNSKRILETKKEFGSFDKYIWAFVNNKPIITQYKFGHKVPVKTSKSECISKDMVRRGFRFVGPTVIHSFMQAAGLTNDHLITCHRHLQCTLLAAPNPNLIKLTTHI